MTTHKKSHSIPSAPSKENNVYSPPEAPDVLLPEDAHPKRTREAGGGDEEDVEMSPNMIEMKQSACDIMHHSGHGSEEVFDHRFHAHSLWCIAGGRNLCLGATFA